MKTLAEEHPEAASSAAGSAATDGAAANRLRAVTPLGIAADRLRELAAQLEQATTSAPTASGLLEEAIKLVEGFERYTEQCATPLSPSLQQLREETLAGVWNTGDDDTGGDDTGGLDTLESEMLSGAAEATLLQMLIRITASRRVLDIGMFTGFSSLAMAQALPVGGAVVACEANARIAAFAQQRFDRAPGGDRIQVCIGPAAETLARLRDAGDRFDLAFLDADKPGYAEYYRLLIDGALLRPGGLLLVDNTLLQGEPYDARPASAGGDAVRQFNRLVLEDDRVEQVLLPLRDGVTLIRRNGQPC
ncbi:MAG: class I SAM-dependent methyltransferase [Planctomycetota bacterium]